MTPGAGDAAPEDAFRPLVVRFGAIGDLIQLTSMLRHLHRVWRRPVDVVTGTGAAPAVLRHLPEVADVVVVGSRRAPYWVSPRQWSAVRRLREEAVGPVWVVDHDPRVERKLARLLGRAGVRETAIVASCTVPRGLLEHTVSYHHRLARQRLDGWPPAPGTDPPEPSPPRMVVTRDEQDDCRRWLERRGCGDAPVVVLQTCSRNLKRGRWPRERWRTAIGAILAALPDARVVLAGAPDEATEVRPLAAACRDARVIEATSDLPLRRLLALLTLAHSCVSLDTGPAHAAAALGCPLVVLTGMADPRRCRPLADRAPVEVVASIPPGEWPDDPYEWQRRNRMEEIGVDSVLEAWRRSNVFEGAKV